MYLTEMLPRDLDCAVREKWPLLVPMGSVEFHGFHLPLGTDSYITEMVASGIEKRLNAVVAPTVHLCPTGFAVSGPEQGTTDIDVELFVRWCRTLVSNYCRMGFARNIFISDLLALRIILHTSFEEMFKGLEPLNRYEQEQKER